MVVVLGVGGEGECGPIGVPSLPIDDRTLRTIQDPPLGWRTLGDRTLLPPKPFCRLANFAGTNNNHR